MMVGFVVPGPPFGKQRPKFSRVGDFVKTYTPEKTVIYENLVKMAYRKDVGTIMLSGPIKAEIRAYFPIPGSVSKKRRTLMENGMIHCQTKPDADNLGKAILDACNNMAYHDDKQIVELQVTKKYSANPRVEVELEELEG